MARGPQSLRGNANAVLNGLIREGVITSFETNFDSASALGILHIAVSADLITDPRIPGYERPKVMAIRNRVTKELKGAGAADVMVSVRSASNDPVRVVGTQVCARIRDVLPLRSLASR